MDRTKSQNVTKSSSHIFVAQFPSCSEFHKPSSPANRSTKGDVTCECSLRLSSTATFSRCPQCGAVTRIKLVEPDLKEPSKERHVFECEECCLPRTYFVEAA